MIELMEETANMLRGMCMDPRIPQDAKEALWSRVGKLDSAVAVALEQQEECIQPCSGCPTPFRCKDTSGCSSAGLSVPTYYVRHPDDSYTVAEPQPVLRA